MRVCLADSDAGSPTAGRTAGATVIVIRPGVFADGPALGDAHAESWKAAYADLFEPSFFEGAVESRRVAWPKAVAELLVPPSFLLVAEIDGRVLAYANGTASEEGAEIGLISGFFSHPDAWGSGAATLLMDAACAELALTYRAAVLWTFAGAARARAFYEKSGFRLTGRTEIEGPSNWLTGETAEQRSVQYRKSLEGLTP
jgi:GNAT superfamily N-acetyltransferase